MLYEWLWLGIWLVDSVVLPTVPETPGHHPKPRVYRHSDADHIMPGVVRWQAAGGSRFNPGQAVGMRLAAAGRIGCLFARIRTAFCLCDIAISAFAEGMSMTCQLLHGERGLADSAGNIRP